MQQPLKILVVEDEMSFALELEMLIEEIGYQLVGVVDNAEEAFAKVLEIPPDLIVMDINIKGKFNGIEIAEKIKHLPIAFLFITSNRTKEMFERAKATNFAGYLVKPIDKFSIQAAIEVAVKTLDNCHSSSANTDVIISSNQFFLKANGIYYRIGVEEILWIGAEGNYINITTDEHSFIIHQTIQKVQSLLPDYFILVHRGYIVNYNKITSVDPNLNKIFIQEQEIPISRRLKKEVLKKLNFLH